MRVRGFRGAFGGALMVIFRLATTTQARCSEGESMRFRKLLEKGREFGEEHRPKDFGFALEPTFIRGIGVREGVISRNSSGIVLFEPIKAE